MDQLFAQYLPLAIFIGVALIFGATVWPRLKNSRRAAFVRAYPLPPGLGDKLVQLRPELRPVDVDLVTEGLRQFFLAYLLSGRKYVAMPSQAADDLWHEFILHTREYQAFCQKAFGGFLHHTPAVALKPQRRRSNAGLRRVWWHCCQEEKIDARNPSRLPLLFALDERLKIPNGFRYHPNCHALAPNAVAGMNCGGDFSSTSFDGTTDGLGGDSGGGDGGNAGTDSGGDGGGGCGGGGD